MKQLTQSNLDPGNCWQTAIACILDLDPEAMPPQHIIEALRQGIGSHGVAYTNALNAYLAKHHGLIYTEIYAFQFNAVKPARELHTINGPTVRSESHLREGRMHINHCVVGRSGEMIWDVHPSRAGLIKAESWGVLGDPPDGWLARIVERENRTDGLRSEVAKLTWACLCPACGNLPALIALNETKAVAPSA